MASRGAIFSERKIKFCNGRRLQGRIYVFPSFAEDGSTSGYMKVVVDRDIATNDKHNDSGEPYESLADVSPAMPWLSAPESGAALLDPPCPADTGSPQKTEQLNAFNRVLEERVAMSTASLQKINATLRDEIAARDRLTDELKEQQREHLQQHEELSRLFSLVRHGKVEWERILDCINEVVLLVDGQGRIKRCNEALVRLVGKGYQELLGQTLEQTFPDYQLPVMDFFHRGMEVVDLPCEILGRWFMLNSYWLHAEGYGGSAVITLYDYTSLRKLSHQLADSNRMLESKSNQLEEASAVLKATHIKMLEHEKMATIGQLAAGVAHEINNPIGYISSNLRTLEKYLDKLKVFVQLQDQALQAKGGRPASVSNACQELKIDFIIEDVVDLIAESLEGAERVRKIVRDLKTFSRVDESEQKSVDLVECLESTINIVWNEIKYKATLVRDYAQLPAIRCCPHQISQVFMNLLLNAVQAIDKEGRITVKTWQEGPMAVLSVTDTGCGIPRENLNRLFEPFFTTKPVGKGTGLGLSLSYEIVQKHRGDIEVESEPGQGATFTVRIPVNADAREQKKNA